MAVSHHRTIGAPVLLESKSASTEWALGGWGFLTAAFTALPTAARIEARVTWSSAAAASLQKILAFEVDGVVQTVGLLADDPVASESQIMGYAATHAVAAFVCTCPLGVVPAGAVIRPKAWIENVATVTATVELYTV